MPQQQAQIDINQLKQAKANVTLTQELLTQAIEKSSSDEILAQEALKQAATEIAQAQTAVSQVQSAMLTQSKSKS
ncbi:hypothetical protein [Bacillus sp. FJAT-42315]|uniref:hypothetical protein n=1 Tax=Bacillus sp. FJAT-42315 TaxID=2014077 RepID=UPI000BA95E84|nr:hypothetical protein [Bacillus sp. FJAT-42315]PAQ15243.1 hypothetical protein CD798_07515 [Bacillaceae bacterium SAOS 7]